MRVLIADDHPLFRDALHQVVTEVSDAAIVVEAHDFTQALALLAQSESFDLILLDLNMPGMEGFTSLLRLRDENPDTPVVVVSASEDSGIIERAMTCGAAGFIPKSTPKDEMIAAIRVVMAGGEYLPGEAHPRPTGRYADLDEQLGSLTKQQRKVLSLLARGKSNKQIAFELDVTNTTVKAHVTAILRKLKVTSRTQAVIVARQIDGLAKA